MTRNLPTLAKAKMQAKALRRDLASDGKSISHGEALEEVARRLSFRDWNALHAAIQKQPAQGWTMGERITGRYLSQDFTATVRSSVQMRPGWFRLVLDLDQPLDVVRFESFSNLRKQIRVEVGPQGHSKEQTSDGIPHVILDQ